MRNTTIGLVVVLVLAAAEVAHADIISYDAFVNKQYTQTANDTVPSDASLNFFSSRLFYTDPGDVGIARGTSGSASRFNYTPEPDNLLATFQTAFISQAALDAYISNGGTFQANVTFGNLRGQSGSATFGPSLFPATPFLTGNSYNQLQGLNPGQSDTVNFNGFTPVSGADESTVFISITRTSDNTSVFSTTLGSGLTSFNIPTGTLDPLTSYNLEIDYSNRVITANAGFNGATFIAGYDSRTEIGFTTTSATSAVPEPASITMLGLGAFAVLGYTRRRKSKDSTNRNSPSVV